MLETRGSQGRPGLKSSIERFAVKDSDIATRMHEQPLAELVFPGPGAEGRRQAALSFADRAFGEIFAAQSPSPELIHVTCTGYSAPSAAQRFVASLASPSRVTHAYHMGCAAAVPALTLAAAKLSSTDHVDVVHTESCSVHADPSRVDAEGIVIESLFADGAIGYRVSRDWQNGFEILATLELIVPETSDLMSWNQSERGFSMRLSRGVPRAIQANVGSFVGRLLESSGLSVAELRSAEFAVHPGGPAIMDAVEAALELEPAKTRHAREVLRRRGNISSATLPTIWEAMFPDLRDGTLVVSLAFAPGLTLAGALLRRTRAP